MLNKPRHSFLPVVFPAFLSSVTWHGGAIEWAIGNPHLLLLHVLATPNVKAMWSKSSSGVGKSQRDLRNPGSPIRTVVMFIASLWERATLQSVRAWPFIGNKTVNVAKILGKSDWWATWVATGSCCKHMCCQGWSSCVASVQTHESTWPKLLPRFHSCCISHQTEQKWAAANHCCNIKSSDSDQQSQTVFSSDYTASQIQSMSWVSFKASASEMQSQRSCSVSAPSSCDSRGDSWKALLACICLDTRCLAWSKPPDRISKT